MSLFPEIWVFQLFCLFWSKILCAITTCYISPLLRDIRALSVPCLNLIVKVKLFFETFNLNSLKTAFLTQVSVAARYRLKSISQKDKSMLLRCTNAHSFKLCYIAGLRRERRAICGFAVLGIKLNHSACAARCLTKWKKGYRGGRCVNGHCVCRK